MLTIESHPFFIGCVEQEHEDNLPPVLPFSLYVDEKLAVPRMAVTREIQNSLAAAYVPRAMLLCEPQLGKRGLYKNLAKKGSSASASLIKDFLSFSDGHHSLLDIAELVSRPAWELQTVCQELLNLGLIEDLAVH